jgi:hypothetical protein
MRASANIALVRSTQSIEVYACCNGIWKSFMDRHLNDVMCAVKVKEQITGIQLPRSIEGNAQTT